MSVSYTHLADTADNGIHAGLLELGHERLAADPVVAQEHHRFLTVLVDDVGHFLHQTGDLAALERLEVLVLLGRHAVLVVVVALINDKLRAEFVADFLLKLLQNIGRNGRRVAEMCIRDRPCKNRTRRWWSKFPSVRP